MAERSPVRRKRAERRRVNCRVQVAEYDQRAVHAASDLLDARELLGAATEVRQPHGSQPVECHHRQLRFIEWHLEAHDRSAVVMSGCGCAHELGRDIAGAHLQPGWLGRVQMRVCLERRRRLFPERCLLNDQNVGPPPKKFDDSRGAEAALDVRRGERERSRRATGARPLEQRLTRRMARPERNGEDRQW